MSYKQFRHGTKYIEGKRYTWLDSRLTKAQAESLKRKEKKNWRSVRIIKTTPPQRAGKGKPVSSYMIMGWGKL